MISDSSFVLARRLGVAMHVYAAYGGVIPELGQVLDPPTEVRSDNAIHIRQGVGHWLGEVLRSDDRRVLTSLPKPGGQLRHEPLQPEPADRVVREAIQWARSYFDVSAAWRNPTKPRRFAALALDNVRGSEEFLVVPLAEKVGARTSATRFIVSELLVADTTSWRQWAGVRRHLPIVDIVDRL